MPSDRIRVTRNGFERADGSPYVPFGVNYYRPGTGWAPQVWKRFDPDATRNDFARLQSMGATCVRVFLTFGSFYTRPGQLDPEGLAKFDLFLDLADEAGLRVHPTGPDHWEGVPEWAQGDRYADEALLNAQVAFWRELAGRYRGRPTIFAYDLLNEPTVRWATPAMHERWDAEIPAAEPAAAGLLDYQHFREEIATTWTARQAEAIRAADPDGLVTVGLIQWAVPAKLPKVDAYAAFRPEKIAPHLDFMEVHFYPLDPVLEYAPEQVESNLAYLEMVVREVAAVEKPVVIAEFGWYGGGIYDEHAAASEADQADWCEALIERSAGMACGWLNWGLYDQPEAGDVSVLTGLLRPDGVPKVWGRRFEELASRHRATACGTHQLPHEPAMNWDACTIDPAAGDAFRAAYRAGKNLGQD